MCTHLIVSHSNKNSIYINTCSIYSTIHYTQYTQLYNTGTYEYPVQVYSIYLCNWYINYMSRVGNTKHENLVFRVYRYKHDDSESKHETNTKKLNKHENNFYRVLIQVVCIAPCNVRVDNIALRPVTLKH